MVFERNLEHSRSDFRSFWGLDGCFRSWFEAPVSHLMAPEKSCLPKKGLDDDVSLKSFLKNLVLYSCRNGGYLFFIGYVACGP